MLYDIKLKLTYEYDAPVSGGRHLVRVYPLTLPGIQRVIASGMHLDPLPSEHNEFTDFFGSRVATLAYRHAHEDLEIAMSARVEVTRTDQDMDFSPPTRCA